MGSGCMLAVKCLITVYFRMFIFAWTALIVHFTLLYSIFDVYFTSPIASNLLHIDSFNVNPTAKRLIFISADGLRAESFFSWNWIKGDSKGFLRSIIEQGNPWGISHTHVPTESRPGHVALLAGFYEDVSSVATGWKENAVDFDSVLNQSAHSWAIGSPDIVPIFAQTSMRKYDHVAPLAYDANWEDFASKKSYNLDLWVFDQLSQLLSNTTHQDRNLFKDKMIIFLHLMGIDTAGHGYGGNSEEYLLNMRIVDECIENMTRQVDKFYGDNGTAYIFTSDHGMTNWGSHGAGHAHETLTPLVVWGAGVGSRSAGASSPLAATPIDVQQADVAPLIAALIGIPIPSNSVGRLPVDYLDLSPRLRALAVCQNFQQLLVQFKHQQAVKLATTFLFRPFKPLTDDKLLSIESTVERLMKVSQYEQAQQLCAGTIDVVLEGVHYYHTYDRLFLGASIVLSYASWIVYVLSVLVVSDTSQSEPMPSRLMLTSRFVTALIAVCIVSLLRMQHAPWTHCWYCTLPLLIISVGFGQICSLLKLARKSLSLNNLMRSILYVLVLAVGLEIVAMSMFWRGSLALGLIGVGVWPLVSGMGERGVSWRAGGRCGLTYGWLTMCAVCGVFPSVPVVSKGASSVALVLTAQLCVLLLVFAASQTHVQQVAWSGLCTCALLTDILLALSVLYTTHESLARGLGLPLVNQLLSWTLLVANSLLPFFLPVNVLSRLGGVFVSTFVTYSLLSQYYEPWFLIVFAGLLIFWLLMELIEFNAPTGVNAIERVFAELATYGLVDYSLRRQTVSVRSGFANISFSDLRRSYMLLLFMAVAFFGTGNIASLNTFDPKSVLSFVTVFRPFTMSFLLLIKQLAPFLLLACVAHSIQVCLALPTQPVYLLLMILSDVLGLQFFFLVKDSGSWLDIGTSISHYVIVLGMTIAVLLLNILAHALCRLRFRVALKAGKSHLL